PRVGQDEGSCTATPRQASPRAFRTSISSAVTSTARSKSSFLTMPASHRASTSNAARSLLDSLPLSSLMSSPLCPSVRSPAGQLPEQPFQVPLGLAADEVNGFQHLVA